ncbi:MAG: hypothetical protein OEZ06_15950 [Myxococcales bacterium]|nr:hypothetical protein [Myxococcales bacterium]
MNAQASDAELLQRTARLVIELCAVLRVIGPREVSGREMREALDGLRDTLAGAQPPFALNVVRGTLLRDRLPLPIDLEAYRKTRQLPGALRQYGLQCLYFERVLDHEELLLLARAIIDATHRSGSTRAPKIPGVRFEQLSVLGQRGTRAEVHADVFATRELAAAEAEVAALLGARGDRWPWQRGRELVRGFERCFAVGRAVTLRALELAPVQDPVARRVLFAALSTADAMEHVGVDATTRRAAVHAALLLGVHGLQPQAGLAAEDAAAAALAAALSGTAQGRQQADRHRLRTSALLHSMGLAPERQHPVAELLRLCYLLSLLRAPAGQQFELTKIDLMAWLAEQLAGGYVHAGWARALLSSHGALAPGSHVMAQGRLAVVAGPGEQPLRPRLLGEAEAAAGEAVTPYSPLGNSPWAK